MKDFGSMTDHDILVVIATKQASMQDSIDQFHDAQAFFNAAIDERVRSLEVHDATISQENAQGLVKVCERVDKLEDFCVSHQAQTREMTRIAAIVAGVITAVGVVFTVFYSV